MRKLIEGGEKIWFNKNARFYHQESETLRQAAPQRLRWAGGRFAIARRYGFKLLFSGVIKNDIVRVSGSLPLILPNPSLAANLTVVVFFISVLLYYVQNSFFYFILFSIIILGQLALFIVGALSTENRKDSLASIVMAPIFLSWKVVIDALSVFGGGTKTWVRTQRKK